MGMEGLNNLYHNWSNEIPSTTIHSASPDKYFKVRAGWFQAVIAELSDSIDKGEIPHDLVPAVEAFMDKYTSPNRSFFNEPTRPEDIEQGDRLLESILGINPTR